MERTGIFRRAGLCALLLAVILLLAGSAAAEEHHTFELKCGGGGFVGRYTPEKRIDAAVVPEAGFTGEDDREWTIEELRQLPDFRLEGAALRFTASGVQGTELMYALTCGESGSVPRTVRNGRNLWDVTGPLTEWMNDPEQALSFVPMFSQAPWGMKVTEGSVSLQLTFSTSAKRPALSAITRHSARTPPSVVSEKVPAPENTAVPEGPVCRWKAAVAVAGSDESGPRLTDNASPVPMAL